MSLRKRKHLSTEAAGATEAAREAAQEATGHEEIVFTDEHDIHQMQLSDFAKGSNVFDTTKNATSPRLFAGPYFTCFNKTEQRITYAGRLTRIQCKYLGKIHDLKDFDKKEGSLREKRCTKACEKSIPYCDFHLLTLKGLEIRDGGVVNKKPIGNGLFAVIPYQVGTYIGFYFADKISKQENELRYGDKENNTSPYVLQVKDEDQRLHYFDSAFYRSYVSTINHKKESEANCRFDYVRYQGKLYPVVVTTKPIRSNQQLFACYSNKKSFNVINPDFDFQHSDSLDADIERRLRSENRFFEKPYYITNEEIISIGGSRGNVCITKYRGEREENSHDIPGDTAVLEEEEDEENAEKAAVAEGAAVAEIVEKKQKRKKIDIYGDDKYGDRSIMKQRREERFNARSKHQEEQEKEKLLNSTLRRGGKIKRRNIQTKKFRF